MNMTQEELNEVIRLHGLWLKSDAAGKRATLTGAILDGANLTRATLTGATLTGATLTGANLTRATLDGATLDGLKISRCDWTDHGEYGRTLSAVYLPHRPATDTTPEQVAGVTYRCGCFVGTEDELREFIADGEERYRKSRTIAVDFCAARMAEMLGVK